MSTKTTNNSRDKMHLYMYNIDEWWMNLQRRKGLGAVDISGTIYTSGLEKKRARRFIGLRLTEMGGFDPEYAGGVDIGTLVAWAKEDEQSGQPLCGSVFDFETMTPIDGAEFPTAGDDDEAEFPASLPHEQVSEMTRRLQRGFASKIELKPNLAPATGEAQSPTAAVLTKPPTKPGSVPAKPTKHHTFIVAEEAFAAVGKSIKGKLVAVFLYRYVDGTEAFRMGRFEKLDGKKEFRPAHPFAGGWRIGDPPGLLPLYGLPELLVANPAVPVLIVEGEKKADVLRSLGFVATTTAHGAQSPAKSDLAPLDKRVVIFMPDAGEAGEKYVTKLARLLAERPGGPASAAVVRLPGLPESGDIIDFIEARPGKSHDEIRAELQALVAKAIPFELPKAGPVLIRGSDIVAKPHDWLTQGVELGTLTIIAGPPKVGKSSVTYDLAACVTTGSPFIHSACQQGSAVIVSGEDDPGRVIRPKMDAQHADPDLWYVLSMVKTFKGDVLCERMFSLSDIDSLEKMLKDLPDCKLVVIDPVGSYLGGDVDAYRDNEVRSVLAPVAKLAEKYNVAVVLVCHWGKGSGNNADDQILGSRAFSGIARAIHHVVKSPDDASLRYFLPGASNLSASTEGWVFRFIPDPLRIGWDKEPVTNAIQITRNSAPHSGL